MSRRFVEQSPAAAGQSLRYWHSMPRSLVSLRQEQDKEAEGSQGYRRPSLPGEPAENARSVWPNQEAARAHDPQEAQDRLQEDPE
uniref:Testis expressed 55 n=1 Tax=Panagrellus redivivus TaxID=6233 RepID=A0A7E4VV31_PANRE